jgi:hypothetical protein
MIDRRELSEAPSTSSPTKERYVNNAYIFVLCPPYSGSTILWKLVATSEAVSSFPKEGQYLPETVELMGHRPWKPDTKMPWDQIIPIWETYWDMDKPLLIEKSPPNLVRTDEILQHFDPVYFLIMVRNPYALCEGLIRRNKRSPERAARFAVRQLQWQADNAEKLENAICFTYEDLTEKPQEVAAKIEAFIPQIGSLDYAQKFKVHSIDGMVNREIVNLNQKKIDNLSPKNLATINKVFEENLDALEYWGYGLYHPPKNHWLTFFSTRVRVFIPVTWQKITRKISKFLGRQ